MPDRAWYRTIEEYADAHKHLSLKKITQEDGNKNIRDIKCITEMLLNLKSEGISFMR